MTVRPIFAWYDIWIGAFWDRKSHKIYLLPVPCFGIVISFARLPADQGNEGGRK